MNKSIEVIAEVAQGYEGDKKLTELLTQGAIYSGADAIKYQLVFADELATPDYEYYKLFKSLEMDSYIWEGVSQQIHKNGQKIYFDIFGKKSLALAKKVSADGVKISTTEFYNRALIREALASFNKIYISVGGISVEDIDSLVKDLLEANHKKICLMYGFQSEPTPLANNNILKLKSLKNRYSDFEVGFMDHSDGGTEEAYNLILLAMGMEISTVEKHITLDRALEIEDYISGLAPDDFKKYVEKVHYYESALGTDKLVLTRLENEYRTKASKLVVALSDLKKGQILVSEDVALKRSGSISGITPIRKLEDAVNKQLTEDIKQNTPISEDQLCEN